LDLIRPKTSRPLSFRRRVGAFLGCPESGEHLRITNPPACCGTDSQSTPNPRGGPASAPSDGSSGRRRDFRPGITPGDRTVQPGKGPGHGRPYEVAVVTPIRFQAAFDCALASAVVESMSSRLSGLAPGKSAVSSNLDGFSGATPSPCRLAVSFLLRRSGSHLTGSRPFP
jgi:hypothetical protein